jgi:hypothetical protein
MPVGGGVFAIVAAASNGCQTVLEAKFKPACLKLQKGTPQQS